MGKCASKLSPFSSLKAPTDFLVLPSSEVREILKTKLRCDHLHLADGNYACLNREDVEKFLSSSSIDKLKYKKQSFDCDDFARALDGRACEWFAGADVEAGIAFGILHGDIRKDDAPDKSRPHAINFFISKDKRVYLIEPQTDNIFKLNKYSTVWFTKL